MYVWEMKRKCEALLLRRNLKSWLTSGRTFCKIKYECPHSACKAASMSSDQRTLEGHTNVAANSFDAAVTHAKCNLHNVQ